MYQTRGNYHTNAHTQGCLGREISSFPSMQLYEIRVAVNTALRNNFLRAEIGGVLKHVYL